VTLADILAGIVFVALNAYAVLAAPISAVVCGTSSR